MASGRLSIEYINRYDGLEGLTMMNNDFIAMLLAGGEGRRLAPLTSRFAKPVVPFGDRFRMIDFPLSNCMNSNIRTVGVLTQYCSESVQSHIGNGEAWLQSGRTRHAGEIASLPADRVTSDGCYTGTADAIYRNIDYIDSHNPEHVLILSGDHIYQMDYRPMLEFHKKNGAAATIAVKKVPWREASRFGIMNTDEQLQIVEFEEKPANPQSNLASMGIYLFRWADLKRSLMEDAINPQSTHDFGKDIIPAVLAAGEKLVAYPYEGYWRDVGTVDSLWEAHMELVEGELVLGSVNWPIRTNKLRMLDKPYIGADAVISESVTHPECSVEGSIIRSVVCSGVTVGKGSELLESVVMAGAQIGRNVTIHKAIIGEGAVVPDGAVIGSLHSEEVTVIEPGKAWVTFPDHRRVLEPLSKLINTSRNGRKVAAR